MFGPLVIAYLFLGGTGAGTCVVASATGLLVPAARLTDGRSAGLVVPGEYRCLLVPALAFATGAVAVGMLCLLADLGNPSAALDVLTVGLASWANVGVVALIACLASSLSQFALIELPLGIPLALLRFLQVFGIVSGLGAAAYTGLLLMDMSGVALWGSPWLAVLFVLSSLGCGLAVFSAVAVLSGINGCFSGFLRRLTTVDLIVIALEAVALAAFVLLRTADGNAMSISASSSVFELVSGSLSRVFWMGAVFTGLIVPFASGLAAMSPVGASAYHLSVRVLISSSFALVGALCLRYCIVMAGAHPYLGAIGAAVQF